MTARQRITCGLLMLASAALGSGVTVWIFEVRPLQQYYAKTHEISRRIQRLESDPPEGVDAHAWSSVTAATGIAFGNIFFGPQHASFEELDRFDTDLRARLARNPEPSLATLEWIWNRAGESGLHGREYVTRFRPLFEEAAEQVRAGSAESEPGP
jgi:hypothetical protein